MNNRIDMDELLRFCLERSPQVLVYKAIFEMVENLEFPIESREHLRKQFVKPDTKAEEQVGAYGKVFSCIHFPYAVEAERP